MLGLLESRHDAILERGEIVLKGLHEAMVRLAIRCAQSSNWTIEELQAALADCDKLNDSNEPDPPPNLDPPLQDQAMDF